MKETISYTKPCKTVITVMTEEQRLAILAIPYDYQDNLRTEAFDEAMDSVLSYQGDNEGNQRIWAAMEVGRVIGCASVKRALSDAFEKALKDSQWEELGGSDDEENSYIDYVLVKKA